MRGFDTLRPSTRVYLVVVVALGLGIIPLGQYIHPIQPSWELLYLAVGTQIAALMTIRTAWGMQTVTTPLLLATGLFAPGAGVCLVCWLAIYDGRRPGQSTTWWGFLFNRANFSLTYGIPSLLLLLVPTDGVWALWSVPIKTLLSIVGVIVINYPLTARVFADLSGTSPLKALIDNVGLTTLRSVAILGFVGGLLNVLLAIPSYVGWVMTPGLFGILIAVRSNYEDSHRNAQERIQTLQLVAQALDARDAYTESHSERVGELAAAMANILGLNAAGVEELRTAGRLHDIGKIGVRDAILNKPGPLDSDEWEVMKTHPVLGAEMILRHSALAKLAPMVRGHHERWNGTGYPDGLNQATIPLGSRILAVADSFDTITTARSYRQSVRSVDAAVEDITSHAASWYDPVVVNALRLHHGMEPIGDEAHEFDTLPFGSPKALQLIATHPRFVRFATGMTISSLGDPLTTVAVLVSLYGLTHDSRVVAAVFALKAIATILIGALASGLPDRLNRRRLILVMEAGRAIILFSTPFLLSMLSLWAVLPIVFMLAAINAVVQPARQAAIPEVVEPREVGAANAAVTAASMVAGALGFALAGLTLFIMKSTAWLFIADGATFAIAGLLVFGVGDLGGGVRSAGTLNGLSTAWAVHRARIHLVVAFTGAFFLSMSFPALINLAYRRVPESGATAYTILEVMLTAGIVIGSVVVGRMKNIGSMRTAAQGLAITGLFSVAVAITPWLWLVAISLLIASAGNPFYSVGNVTALMDVSDSSNRGTIMSSRFAVTQLALILGTTTGGFVSGVIGPEATYGLLGFGLLGVAAVVAVLSRERRVVGEAAP